MENPQPFSQPVEISVVTENPIFNKIPLTPKDIFERSLREYIEGDEESSENVGRCACEYLKHLRESGSPITSLDLVNKYNVFNLYVTRTNPIPPNIEVKNSH